MEAAYKYCQSCGMPLTKDPKGGGTDADGATSRVYCSHCWVDGRFTLPDLTAEQMKTHVIGKLQEMGFPRMLARLFARNVPKLKRWKP